MIKYTLNILISVLFLSNLVLSQSEDLNVLIEQYHQFQDQKLNRLESTWKIIDQKKILDEQQWMKDFLDSLALIDQQKINEQEQINIELLEFIIKDQLYLYEYGDYYFPLSSEGGFLIEMMYNYPRSGLHSKLSIDNYKLKLLSTTKYIDHQIFNLKVGLEKFKTMPKLVVENCLNLAKQFADDKIEDHFLFQAVIESDLTKEQVLEFEQIMKEEVIPSFKKLSLFLENEYLQHTRKAVGISSNQGGRKFYQQRCKYYTTLDLSPEAVYEKGLEEVARIKSEMLDIIEQLEYKGSFEDFLDFLRNDPQFYAQSSEQLLHHAAWLTVKSQEILPKYFGKLPSLSLTVNPVPEAIAPSYTTGRYSPGSMREGRAGQYLVNTYNLTSRPLYVLPALTLHEGVPGHHLQISLAKELDKLPRFRQQQYLSAYGEGWGLYAEFLGKEAGIYTTLYEEFGRLTYEMWRACRLVVDPGMHYLNWTRDQAVQYMKDNTALSLHEINTEINRYIGWPGQAISYKIGELKIRELRKRAENKLGSSFDIRKFHDLILSNGSILLSTLERLVDQYISANLSDKH